MTKHLQCYYWITFCHRYECCLPFAPLQFMGSFIFMMGMKQKTQFVLSFLMDIDSSNQKSSNHMCKRSSPIASFQQPFLDYRAKELSLTVDMINQVPHQLPWRRRGLLQVQDQLGLHIEFQVSKGYRGRHCFNMLFSLSPALLWSTGSSLLISCIWFIVPSIVEQSLGESWSEKIV